MMGLGSNHVVALTLALSWIIFNDSWREKSWKASLLFSSLTAFRNLNQTFWWHGLAVWMLCKWGVNCRRTESLFLPSTRCIFATAVSEISLNREQFFSLWIPKHCPWSPSWVTCIFLIGNFTFSVIFRKALRSSPGTSLVCVGQRVENLKVGSKSPHRL